MESSTVASSNAAQLISWPQERLTLQPRRSKMASSVADTFTCFPDLPAELQKTIWEAAAVDPPVLDIQRFTAEIIPDPHNLNRRGRPRFMLCFTPHADFINLTAGHRGLFGACKESRKAAQRHMDCPTLPIHYPARDSDGKLIPRQASVPFNPAGHVCLSGLGRALEDAYLEHQGGQGPRRTRRSYRDFASSVFGRLEETTAFPIRYLMITADRDPREHRRPGMHKISYMGGYVDQAFGLLASQLPNLETVSILGEGIVDRRHHLDQFGFSRIHEIAPVVHWRRGQTDAGWDWIWREWYRHQALFYAIARTKLGELDRNQSQDPDGAATAVMKTELELNLKAVMDWEAY